MPEPTDTNRFSLVVLAALALAGVALGWNKGQLPEREITVTDGALNALSEGQTAPDLALYRDVVADVRNGRDYYSAARQRIPQYGFPISSPLNWRLPTYAWLFALLPGEMAIQAVLVILSIVALGMAFRAQKQCGIGQAVLTTLLLIGVVRWALDGQAYLAQEPWAATLILISLAAHALGEKYRWLAILTGITALLFRELALPYCGIALLVAAWDGRWKEAAGWFTGIALFFALFAWHIGQVRGQLAGTEIAAATGLSQWLRFGGLDFVLLTTRMNGLFFTAPGWLLWLYLLVSLVGLSRRNDSTSRLACLSALAYLLAFALLGRPENFYWGLLAAPLLAWGTADGLRSLLNWPSPAAEADLPVPA